MSMVEPTHCADAAETVADRMAPPHQAMDRDFM
ncbi:MAG: hypothetical protein ACI8WY_000121 [Planctomycetota bacterium]|jgi:hypothetical protein